MRAEPARRRVGDAEEMKAEFLEFIGDRAKNVKGRGGGGGGGEGRGANAQARERLASFRRAANA